MRLSLFNIYEDVPFQGVSHIKKVKSEDIENTFITPITNIKSKVILVNVRNARYVCALANNVEIQ